MKVLIRRNTVIQITQIVIKMQANMYAVSTKVFAKKTFKNDSKTLQFT